MNIKGKSKIQLFENGVEVQNHDNENLVTDTLKNAFEASFNYLTNPLNGNGLFLDSLITTKASDLIGGLMIHKDILPETKDVCLPHAIPIGYAGTNYNNTNNNRGNYNTIESGVIRDGSKEIGFRFVWDFGTNQVNNTFSCLSLTTKNTGDMLFDGSINNTTPITFKPNYSTNYSKSKYPDFTIPVTKNGDNVYIDDTGIYIKVLNKYKISSTPQNWTSNIYLFKSELYSNISKSLVIYDDIIILVAKKISDSKYYLITYNTKTSIIVTEKCLEETSDVFSKFGLYGDYILFNIPKDLDWYNRNSPYGLRLVCDRLNLKTMTKDKFTFFDVQSYWDPSYNNLFAMSLKTIKTGEKFICYISYMNRNGSYGLSGNEILFPNEDRAKAIEYNSSNSRLSTGNIDSTCACFSTTSWNSPSDGLNGFALLHYPVFTINNLETPITKTAANTMKITYELTWDK